jgi:hypothetical protein
MEQDIRARPGGTFRHTFFGRGIGLSHPYPLPRVSRSSRNLYPLCGLLLSIVSALASSSPARAQQPPTALQPPLPAANPPADADIPPALTHALNDLYQDNALTLPPPTLSLAPAPSAPLATPAFARRSRTAPRPSAREGLDNNPDPSGRGMSAIARRRAERQIDDTEDPSFPNLRDDPLRQLDTPPDDRDPFLFPWLMNLIYEDRWLLEADPAKTRRRRLLRQAKINIRDPDPDTANFPNGAYTLPKGRLYIESSPLSNYGSSRITAPQYNWETLIRYGLTDNLEIRMFTNGLTVRKGSSPTTGFSPVAFDVKANFWEENLDHYIPAMGLEAYIQTTFGSPAFNSGLQPSLSLLFDQTLPFEINFEYNFSLSGVGLPNGASIYQFGFQWSFQREVFKDFDIFVHGFYNAANLPRLPGISSIPSASHPQVVVVGIGAIWTLTDRLAIFGSYNVGLTPDSPSTIALMGFAVAF